MDRFYWLILVALWIGCATSDKVTNTHDSIPVKVEFDPDRSLLIQLELFPDHVLLKRIKVLDSPFKPLAGHISQNEVVKLEFLNNNKDRILEMTTNNPLIQYQEYADDLGKMHRIRVDKKVSSLLVRIKYSSEYVWLRIWYGDGDSFSEKSLLYLAQNE